MEMLPPRCGRHSCNSLATAMRSIPSSVGARTGLVVSVLVASVTLLGVFSETSTWVGVWAETWRALGDALILVGPVAACLGAWVGARSRSGGLETLAMHATRSTAVVNLREALTVAAFACGGYVVAVVSALVATYLDASQELPTLFPLVPALAFVATSSCVGAFLGRLGPGLFTAPIVLVGVYVVIGAMVYVTPEILGALTPIDGRYMTGYHVAGWIHLAQGLFLGLVFCATVLFRSGERRTAVIALWCAGLVASPLLLIGDADRQPDIEASSIDCVRSNGDTVVCSPRAKSYLATDLASSYNQVQTVLDPLLPQRVGIINDQSDITHEGDEISAAIDHIQSSDRSVLFLSDFADISASTQVVDSALQVGLLYKTVPLRASSENSWNYAVQYWAYRELGMPTDGTAAPGAPNFDLDRESLASRKESLAWLSSLDDDARRVWFKRHADAIQSDSLERRDFEIAG